MTTVEPELSLTNTRTAVGYGPIRPRRLLVALILVALAVFPGDLGALTRSLMTDAFVQVSVYVAATLNKDTSQASLWPIPN